VSCTSGKEEVNTDPRDVLSRPSRPPDLVIRYGHEQSQVADLRLPARPENGPRPAGAPAPLVIFLHGGFWRATYDRAHTGPLAESLAADGYAVCAPEFRRTGQPGGGWPGTFDDVAAAVDTLPALVAEAAGDQVDPGRVVLAGHSAGGHLALWAASRHRLAPGTPWALPQPPAIRGVVPLGAVTDLSSCFWLRLGHGAAADLLGGGPGPYAGRYAATDPMRLLPAGARVRLVHGRDDDIVPCAMSLDYAARAQAAGDDAACTVLPRTGHFELIDPLTAAWTHVAGTIRALCSPPEPARP
jgi:acetyl esterase/lipase